MNATTLHADDLDGNGLDDVILGLDPELRVQLTPLTGSPILLDPVFLGGAPISIASGTFDPDPYTDVAVLTSNQRIRILSGQGTGALTVTASIVLPNSATSVRAGDTDDDGDIDLVAAIESTGEFLIWPNAGDGSFGVPTSVLRGFYPRHVELVDMDLDGRLDIFAVGNWNGWKAQVLRQTGPNLFAPLTAVPVVPNVRGVQIADLDGNATPDVLLDADTPQVLLTNNVGQLTPSTIFNSLLGRPFAVDVNPAAGLELIGFAGGCSTAMMYTRRNVADCNANGIQDQAEILASPAIDIDTDGVIDACENPGVAFCFGDGTGVACPCDPGQSGDLGGGCRNSFGGTGILAATGNASVTLDSVTLRATGFLPSGIGLLFQGNSQQGSGLGGLFGDGLLCVNQSVIRLALRNAVGGVITFGRAVPGDPSVALVGNVPVVGAARHYQIWYRDPAPYCTTSTFNLTNGVTIAWQP